jgi:hypothetical protein
MSKGIHAPRRVINQVFNSCLDTADVLAKLGGMKCGPLPRSFVASCGASFLLFATGCVAPEPAPADLDGLARFFFGGFEPEDKDASLVDVELQDGFTKLHAILDGDDLAEARRGILANMTQAELDAVGMSARNPDVPQGIYIANVIRCTLDRLESLVLEPDQLSLYPEAYASYERTFDADRPPSHPTWTLTYTSSENAIITNQFTATVKSGLRKIPATEDASFGRVLLRRGFLPSPATFENPSDSVEFSHDFQVETYHERAPGEIVHFYGIWRYMKLGILGDSYDGVFIDQTLAGMIDWDKKTDALCAGE